MALLDNILDGAGLEQAVEADARRVFATGDETRATFYARVNKIAAQLATTLPQRDLMRALGEESSLETLLMAMLLARGELALSRRDAPLVKGLQARQKLLQGESGTMTSTRLGEVLGITRQHVNLLRDQGKLLGIEFGRLGYQYPAWQLGANGKPLPGLDRVLAALDRPSVDEWSKLIFFLEPHDALSTKGREVTPLEALRRGQIDAAVAVAGSWGPPS